ncbi:C2H2-type zinc finger protein [Klebsiella pneumoniae]|uniref:C2H2-type zinc finger protein n=1 Tax=Klebsiella pneumoniae TaxID=573 RepID=UPI00404588DE
MAIDQIAQSGLSSLSVIYYSAQLFRLRKHIKKHTKSLEKNLAKANSTKKAEHEKMLIQERIARTGSAFKNESERNKYFERRRAENPIFDIDTPIRKASFIVNAGAFGLGKSRKN